MRLGIFGGSFDPIHMGHLIIAEYAKEYMNLDKVIFIPVGNPSHRADKLLDANHRLHMVKLAIEGNLDFEVSDIEIKACGKNYTYDTLLEIKKLYPEAQIFQIIGEDSADYLHLWKNSEELIKLCKFLVFRRDGYSYTSDNENIIVMDSPKISLSATLVRDRLNEGKSIKYMVSKEVEEYIRKNSLYKD